MFKTGMIRHCVTAACVLCAFLSLQADRAPLKTLAEVGEAIRQKQEWTPFMLDVKVHSPLLGRGGGAFLAEDASGRTIIHVVPRCDASSVHPGAILRIAGETSRRDLSDPDGAMAPFAKNITAIGDEDVPPPPAAKIRDILDGKWDLRYVTVSGTVKDAFHDDVDPNFAFLTLVQEGASMYVPLYKQSGRTVALADLIGAEVSVSGIVHENDRTDARRYADVTIFCGGFDAVRILRKSDGMDSIPFLEDVRSLTPATISTLDRRRVQGRVVAVWGGNWFLMKTAAGDLMRIELADRTPPRFGERVEVAGFPGTDLFNINLESAMWRSAPDGASPPPDAPPVSVFANRLLTRTEGVRVANSRFFGRTVSLEGGVLNVSASGEGRILLESDGLTLPIDASACPAAFDGLVAGCRVAVTGVFVFNADDWRANDIFPKIHDVAVVVRAQEDVQILSRPSWWSVGRLLFVVGILLAVIAGVLVWNMSLRILAERRGQALYRVRMAKTATELRLDERTRLATELHDYISQDLTALSYQVTGARRTRGVDPAACEAYLETADRMLVSCRTELRRCLWDLRNETLDERNVGKAVRTSIAPLVGDVEVTVDMDVPRKNLDDSSMHAMLSIIRELVSNAINHGHAKAISIHGTVCGDRLTLSVVDDGIGFDVAKASGIDDGHFGLAGVRERANRHGGDLSVESTPGKGTCITVTLRSTTPKSI